MISKYASKVKIKNDVYAIFNSIVMLPIFVTKEQCDNIFSEKLSAINNEEKTELIKAGILVDDESVDEKMFSILKKAQTNMAKNKVTIMYIIPTNICNLKCKYCFIGKLNDKQVKMNKKIAISAIDKFNSHLESINETGTVFFYGAEPLLNFDLIKYIVKYTKEKKYKINYAMVSNGILLTEQIADFIKENNISLGISIDGPKEITDSNRVFKGSDSSVYDSVLSKIQMLKRKKVNFGLSITVAPVFLEREEEFLEWLLALDVHNISYNLLHFTYKTDEWREYYKKATKFIYKSNCLLFDKGFNEDRVNRKYESFYNRVFKFSDCGAVGGNQITVCPTGDIEICHGYWNRKDKKLPNIMSINSLNDLFKEQEYKKWSENVTVNKKKCLSCPAIYICGGGCSMQANDLFGSEEHIDKAFCIHTKQMLKYLLTEVYNDSH